MLKVLIVDDEHVLADTLTIILNNAGFDASAVYSGREAINAAKTLSPDFIISDISMPEMTGIEAMIIIRGILPACKIILFTGCAAIDLLEQARKQGHSFEILSKPVHPANLIARLSGSWWTP